MSVISKISPYANELRSNQRLRLGIWCIIAILLLYIIVLVSDDRKALESEYADKLAYGKRLSSMVKEDIWRERAAEAKALRVQFESSLETADSRGLAHANIQAWLDRQIKRLGIQDSRIKVDPVADVSGEKNIFQVPATVTAQYEPAKFFGLLYAIENGEKLRSVEQLDIQDQKNQQFTIVFKTYFQGNFGGRE